MPILLLSLTCVYIAYQLINSNMFTVLTNIRGMTSSGSIPLSDSIFDSIYFMLISEKKFDKCVEVLKQNKQYISVYVQWCIQRDRLS